jgi:hypothetical protein
VGGSGRVALRFSGLVEARSNRTASDERSEIKVSCEEQASVFSLSNLQSKFG